MSKSKWFKNKETGEVVYLEGYTQSGAVVVRSRDRTLKWVGPIDFRNWYTPTNTSGFPPVKPKPKFNPYSKYYEKIGFFVPCAYTDKRFAYYEYTGLGNSYVLAGYRTVEFVENLFRLGVLTTEPQRKPVDVAKELKAVIDRSPKLQSDLAKMLKPKKLLMEWAVRKPLPSRGYSLELWPEDSFPVGGTKTGRTVEVPQ